MGGRTDGSTTDCWQNGRFYRGRATERVVERAVLPWNHGRTGGSTNFWGRHEHYLWRLLIVFCFHLPWDRLPGPQMNPEGRGFIPVGPRGGPG